MTPKQSLIRKHSRTRSQSLTRRLLVVLSAVLLATAWAVGISAPASAADKGSLQIRSITDQKSGLGGPVQDRAFDVVVRVLDTDGQPMTVNQATTIRLEEASSGPGSLEGNTTAIIERNSSSATIKGAIFTQFDNGVTLRVRAVSGVQLAPDEETVDVALTAVGAEATVDKALNVKDPDCAAPTRAVPTCGQFNLANGARGHVTLSVGSCEDLGNCKTVGDIRALVITAIADMKDSSGNPLYKKTSPASLVVACDKDLCRETANGVPKLPVIYTLNNTGSLNEVAGGPDGPVCPAKGVVGPNQEACVDYTQSRRQNGDLYLVLLFVADARASM